MTVPILDYDYTLLFVGWKRLIRQRKVGEGIKEHCSYYKGTKDIMFTLYHEKKGKKTTSDVVK